MTSKQLCTVSQVLAEARALLRLTSLSADLDARILLEHCANIPRIKLLAEPNLRLGSPIVEMFRELTLRRSKGEPVSHLIGKREFYGREFRVTPAVLDPRPETELLIETAIQCCKQVAKSSISILDAGTGSGCIAITLAKELSSLGIDAHITAIDVSGLALEVARANARHMDANVTFIESDWFQHVSDGTRFDVIVSNPPYIADADVNVSPETKFEPRGALYSGPSGLEAVFFLLSHSPHYLVSSGHLIIETGDGQHGAIFSEVRRIGGWSYVPSICDLAGRERVVWLTKIE